ncbi:hypothetical protein T265_09473 [Opisthorchis viverrini]|uniref:DUF7041 domain-containing protein n=1 Tax=Opisthorchis viverrini TaxID=6198 RepID=A0A074Z5L6_OPIVI|nr:hypothetical protein T265_09473 [Opisthorchis viverrini]KER22426.1 hypothetical protein T265_09473 [Opisthorchis viverrini]
MRLQGKHPVNGAVLKELWQQSLLIELWPESISVILLGIRNTVKEDIRCTPVQLVYGQTLRLPGDMQTMFSYMVSQLPSEVATEVVDLMDPMLASNPYTTLKTAIIKRTATPDEANLQKLLAGVKLGDRTT